MRNASDFRAAYEALERRMKALADDDGDVFLPNPEPQGPAQYVFVCMEPSLGRWASDATQATSKIAAGFRNFLPSDDVALLHYSIRNYLCRPGERYHLTDFSKGAMRVQQAGPKRGTRYERWYPLLEEELDLIATADTHIIAVGNAVSQQLEQRAFRRPFTSIVHYSSQAALARRRALVGREEAFRAFEYSVSREDVIAAAMEVLASAQVPTAIAEETLAKLRRFQLTPSRQQLMFTYKLAFESLRS
jgi:hypothetical protein